jgi:hypothetical protein
MNPFGFPTLCPCSLRHLFCFSWTTIKITIFIYFLYACFTEQVPQMKFLNLSFHIFEPTNFFACCMSNFHIRVSFAKPLLSKGSAIFWCHRKLILVWAFHRYENDYFLPFWCTIPIVSDAIFSWHSFCPYFVLFLVVDKSPRWYVIVEKVILYVHFRCIILAILLPMFPYALSPFKFLLWPVDLVIVFTESMLL